MKALIKSIAVGMVVAAVASVSMFAAAAVAALIGALKYVQAKGI